MTYMIRQLCGLSIVLGPNLSTILTVQEDAAEGVYHHGQGPSQQPQAQDRSPVNGSTSAQWKADSGSRDQANLLDGARWTHSIVKIFSKLWHDL